MLAKIISKIKDEQNRVAHDLAKVRPGDGKDVGYEFGHRQGVYFGLQSALQLIENLLRDQDKDHDF